MTQFLIFTGPKPNLSEYNEFFSVPLLSDVVSNYVGESIQKADQQTSWVLRGGKGEPGHQLCDNAIIELQSNCEFIDTKLGKILFSYAKIAKQITLFYGTDSENLLPFSSEKEFLNHVEECLTGKGETPWEIYAEFHCPANKSL